MTLRTATRRAFLYPAAATSGETWADYANGVLDSLLALEFRNAPSLAGATLYGSTPSVVSEPGGGLVLSASGLECSADTLLDTGITRTSATDAALFVLCPTVSNSGWAIGSLDGSGTRHHIRPNDAGNTWYGNGNNLQYAYAGTHFGFISQNPYRDGVDVGTIPSGNLSGNTRSVYIGGLNFSGGNFEFSGVIAAVCMGVLKAGQDAATVASELYTRMQTAAL